jgi:general secretion pathway protein G
MKNRTNGFSILELLIVVAIIGILSLIVISNYLTAMTRARQKRTMADMRTIAIAWESRAGETRAYNAAGATFSVPVTPITVGSLSALLVPTYLKNLPKVDGWGKSLDFSADAATNAKTYAIRSAGADGAFSGNAYETGTTTDKDCDIVYSGGSFVTYPEQSQ